MERTHRTSHHRRPMGGRGNRRTGGRPASAPYTLASDPLTRLWWDPTTVSGAVSAWVDRVAAVSASNGTGAQQPTASSTAIGGAYPGVTSDGGDILTAAGAGAVLGGKTSLTVTAAMIDTGTAASFALELTANGIANDGGLFIITNLDAVGRLSGGIRGTSNWTGRLVAAEPLTTVKVVSIGYSFATAGAGAIPFIRVNGVSQALANHSALSAAGSAANASLHLFSRTGLSQPWTGTFGDICFRESVAEDAALLAAERFIGARVGLSF